MVFKKGLGYWTGKKRKPFSEEWKNKIGKYHKGKPKSNEQRKKQSESLKKYWDNNPESRKKISERSKKLAIAGKIGFKKGNTIRKDVDPWNKHKTAKDDVRILKHANLIDKQTGKPLNYIDGKSDKYRLDRLKMAAELRQWRNKVYLRDNYTCQMCGVRNGGGKKIELVAHHIKSFANYKDLRIDLNNGQTLCKECHSKTNNYCGRESWHKIKGNK